VEAELDPVDQSMNLVRERWVAKPDQPTGVTVHEVVSASSRHPSMGPCLRWSLAQLMQWSVKGAKWEWTIRMARSNQIVADSAAIKEERAVVSEFLASLFVPVP
jgi:hypothetical protein